MWTHFGKRFVNEEDAPRRIGESWELSLGPELPSEVADSGVTLAAEIERAPDAWLGSQGERAAALLVKLLDADEPLSVQIHPSDEYPGLGPGEAGKPESWYVVHRDPGAWVAFGWRDDIGREDVLGALARADGSLAAMLQKVEVEVGDVFVVDAGTPHAIGAGVTLVEPQYVARGRRGVTYRYWDWDRRYDAEGRLDPAGRPRALAVDDALAVTDWDGACGRALLDRCFLRAGPPASTAPLAVEGLVGRAARLGSRWLGVDRVAGTGSLAWAPVDGLSALTVVEGEAELLDEDGRIVVRATAGRTIAVPARTTPLVLCGRGLHAVHSYVATSPEAATGGR
ncbi:MAG: class I mannose-6-phosphate isomerase [Sandaracinaceae bacterium]